MSRHTYCRASDLPKLVGLWQHEVLDESREAHIRLLQKIECALRAERRRGQSGSWTYNLARHDQLLTAYREERRAWLRRGRS